MFKLVQKQAYTFMSYRHGVVLIFIGFVVIIISAFHFGETSLEWSRDQYSQMFNIYHDNIAGKAFQNRMCLPIPIDAVYTWVNGSDPKLQEELNKVKEKLERESTKATLLTDEDDTNHFLCKHDNCVPGRLVIFKEVVLSISVHTMELARSHIAFANADSLFNMTKSGTGNMTVARFNKQEDVNTIMKEKPFIIAMDRNISLSKGYLTNDWLAEGVIELRDAAFVSGVGKDVTEDELRLKIPEEQRVHVRHVDLTSSAGVAVITLRTAEVTKNFITEFMKSEGVDGMKVETAYLAWDLEKGSGHDEDVSSSRFQDNEEMRYSLRSLEQNAPWIRQVYIITNGQIPSWLNLDNPRITLVSHEEIFLNKSHLPTFSSPAIESNIHRIPGLSDKFIYLNDDTLFGKPVWPDDFYTHSRGQKVYLTWPVPNCAEGCPPSWILDNYCDLACNNSACDWDGGDCDGATKGGGGAAAGIGGGVLLDQPDLVCNSGCSNGWIADRYCDQTCNVPSCGFDAGDCGIVNFHRLYSANIKGLNETVTIPQGVGVFYLNLTSVLGVNVSITEAVYEECKAIRTATVAQKFNLLSFVLHTNISTTTLDVKVHGKNVNDEVIGITIKLIVNTIPIPERALINVSDEADEDKSKEDEGNILAVPFLEVAEDLREPAIRRDFSIPGELASFEVQDLPESLAEQLVILDGQLTAGDITEKGHKKLKYILLHAYLQSPDFAGKRHKKVDQREPRDASRNGNNQIKRLDSSDGKRETNDIPIVRYQERFQPLGDSDVERRHEPNQFGLKRAPDIRNNNDNNMEIQQLYKNMDSELLIQKPLHQPLNPQEKLERPLSPQQQLGQPIHPQQQLEQPLNPQQQLGQPINPQQQLEQPLNPQQQLEQPLNPQQQLAQPINPQQQLEQPLNPQQQLGQPINPQQQLKQPLNPQQQLEQPLNSQQQFAQPINPQQQFAQPINPQRQLGQPINPQRLNPQLSNNFPPKSNDGRTGVKINQHRRNRINDQQPLLFNKKEPHQGGFNRLKPVQEDQNNWRNPALINNQPVLPDGMNQQWNQGNQFDFQNQFADKRQGKPVDRRVPVETGLNQPMPVQQQQQQLQPQPLDKTGFNRPEPVQQDVRDKEHDTRGNQPKAVLASLDKIAGEMDKLIAQRDGQDLKEEPERGGNLQNNKQIVANDLPMKREVRGRRKKTSNNVKDDDDDNVLLFGRKLLSEDSSTIISELKQLKNMSQSSSFNVLSVMSNSTQMTTRDFLSNKELAGRAARHHGKSSMRMTAVIGDNNSLKTSGKVAANVDKLKQGREGDDGDVVAVGELTDEDLQKIVDNAEKFIKRTSFLPWERADENADRGRNGTTNQESSLSDYQTSSFRSRGLRDTFGDSLVHVNRLFNKKFGFISRKVPGHIPHMIDVNVMRDLQAEFPEEFNATSSHQIRHSRDMQFAFSYMYYVVGVPKEGDTNEIFNEFDTDHSGVLSDREIRTLATRLYSLPLDLETLGMLENNFIQCAKNLSKDIYEDSTLVEEKYYETKMPQVTSVLVAKCPAVSDLMKNSVKGQTKYKHEVMGDEEIAFKMIRTNVSQVIGQLDDIRKNPKKFVCLNDNIDHSNNDAGMVKAVLQDFYEAMFPISSQFELPREYRNRFLHIDELREWRRYRNWLQFWTQLSLSALVLFSIGSFCSRQVVALRRRCCPRWRTRVAETIQHV